MNNAFVNPLAPKGSNVIEAARTIKRWTRERLDLEETAIISVNELACHLPGCPPRETVILVMEGTRRPLQFSVHKALTEVTRDDVLAAAPVRER